MLGIAPNTVKTYMREIEKRQLSCTGLLEMEDEALEALFVSSETADGLFATLLYMLPNFARELLQLNRVGVNRWMCWNEYG